jgi:hypothetical protein
VWAAGEIAFFEPEVVQHSLDDRYVFRLTAVRSARNRELFLAPPQRIESAGAQKWNDLEWFGAGSPIRERVWVASRAKELVGFSDDCGVDMVLGFNSFTASDGNIQLIRSHGSWRSELKNAIYASRCSHAFCCRSQPSPPDASQNSLTVSPARYRSIATHVDEDVVQFRHCLHQLIVELLVAEQFLDGAVPLTSHHQRVGTTTLTKCT